MKTFFTLFSSLLLVAGSLSAQTTFLFDFEDQNIPQDSFINDSGGDGFTIDDFINLPNTFTQTETFSFWSGWALSSVKDTTDPAFTNQYASFTGGGADGSDNYAVAFSDAAIVNLAAPTHFDSLEVTNTTYAALTIRDGNQFSKAFGGPSGDDPDFFLLTIVGRTASGETDSIEFYLADYRFDDNSQDYIVYEWTTLDVSSIGFTDSLHFRFSGSDNNEFGLVTPAYVAVDNISYGGDPLSVRNVPASEFSVFPNPATDRLFVRAEFDWEEYRIVSLTGQLLGRGRGGRGISIADLPRGNYLLQLLTRDGRVANRIFNKL